MVYCDWLGRGIGPDCRHRNDVRPGEKTQGAETAKATEGQKGKTAQTGKKEKIIYRLREMKKEAGYQLLPLFLITL